MQHSETVKDLAGAMAQAQGEMPVVAFDGQNPFLKNRYATLGALIQSARPILAKHGLSVIQFPTAGTPGNIGVETVIMHTSGQWISNEMELHAHEEKGKSDAQVAGSIVTYLRRYAYAAALGIVSDEDTDGHREHAPRPQSAPAARQTPAARPVSATPPAAKMGGSGRAQVPNFEVQGMVERIYSKDGEGSRGPWHKTDVIVSGDRYSTFDEELGLRAVELDGCEVRVTYKPGKVFNGVEGRDLLTIEGVDQSRMAILDSPDLDDERSPFDDE